MTSPSHQQLIIKELFTGSYTIPLYQRNFSWTFNEIKQLVEDIEDASSEQKDQYYIGTLALDSKNNIIDGQQRSTALTLIALALQNKFDQTILSRIPLSFSAREKSNQTLHLLLDKSLPEEHDEISRGYLAAYEALKEIQDLNAFTDYLLHSVIIFKMILPEHLDLNLYFERFNSRGEQLVAHEIIKAQMMGKLNSVQASKFAKIWEACAEMDTPVITAFQARTKRRQDHLEREKIFGYSCDHYSLNQPYQHILATNQQQQSILEALQEERQDDSLTNQVGGNAGDYRTILPFESLLLYSLGIINQVDVDQVQLDDKKLLALFHIEDKSADWCISFSILLLQLRHLFDTFIIRNANEEGGNRKKDDWFLQRASYYEYQNGGKGSDYYVTTTFHNNTFPGTLNRDIIQAQSLFAVTFTSPRASRWLYETMYYLYQHIEELNHPEFGSKFLKKLESMAIRYANEQIFDKDQPEQIKSYTQGIPIYALNFIDYVLWTQRTELKEHFYDANHFRFRYRRSIEHWYPQHPSEQLEKIELESSTLHSIGNLALITDSQNSKFSNLTPLSKFTEWKEIFQHQSLKLQWMAKMTDSLHVWDEEQIQNLTAEIERRVQNFITKS